MSVSGQSDFHQLIASLDKSDRGGQHLQPGVRNHLIQEIERCLIDMDGLDPYIDALQAIIASQGRYADLLKAKDLAKVLQHGLSILDDGALLRITLNPVALKQLHDRIAHFQAVGDYWFDLMLLAELEDRGLSNWKDWLKLVKQV